MPKTATIGVRVDEDLKQRAQNVLDDMGLPMSLSVELFLKYVADNEKLPFSLGNADEGPSAEELKEKEKREQAFWKSFMTWYFRVWPMFESPDSAKRAEEEYGFTCQTAGSAARSYISGIDGSLREMTDGQRAAYFDVSAMQTLLSEAKELVYWALDMDKTFVPHLAMKYNGQLDKWRLAYLKKDAREQAGKGGRRVAEGVVGDRYFADL